MAFGIWHSELGFEIWNWLLESGIRFEVFGSVWSHYGTAILSSGHCAGTILIVYLFGWKVWYRAVSSTEQGGCWLCLCKIRRRCQFRIIREFFHCVLPHYEFVWHAAVRCHSGTYSGTYSGESFCTHSAQLVGVIIYIILRSIYKGLYQGHPSLCSSLPLHRRNCPRFRD